jgi:kynurenine 3-monooxygenase
MPHFEREWTENPVGQMVTVKTHRWNRGGDALLLGDAAHAIVPFFGQGMNCGFEDCSLLRERMQAGEASWESLFSAFSDARRADADAIADLALENFIEMRDRVADPEFLKEREIERILQKEFPRDYVSRYALVSFSRVPYRMAKKAGEIQAGILQELGRGIARAADVDLVRAKQRIDQELKGLY